MITYDETVEFIQKAHAGEEHSGEPYYKHPVRVAGYLGTSAPLPVQQAALLHDVVEDTGYSLRDLLDFGFGPYTVSLVNTLTRKNETYMEMIERICNTGDEWAIRIKLADNKDNSSRPGMPPGLEKRYNKARARLEQALSDLNK